MKPGKLPHTESEEASLPHPVATEGMVVVDLRFELVAWDHGAVAILNGIGGGIINGDAHFPAHFPAEIVRFRQACMKSAGHDW